MSARDGGLPIGELARRTGTKVQTIRYYEEIGLLPAPARTAGNQRAYARRHLERLAFVRHARELGFPLPAIREMLALGDDPNQPCHAVDAIARRQLAAVRSRIARLRALEAELERMLARCGGQGRVADCRVIEILADHSHARCLDPTHGASAGDDELGGLTPA